MFTSSGENRFMPHIRMLDIETMVLSYKRILIFVYDELDFWELDILYVKLPLLCIRKNDL